MKELSDSLVEEILTEVAEGFLGERKQVEEQRRVFNDFVARLKQSAQKIEKRAALVNYLLVDPRHVAAFYRCIGTDQHPFAAVAGRIEKGIPLPQPCFVIRKKNRYIQLLFSAYTALKTDLDNYLHGSLDPGAQSEKMENGVPDVNLRMVMIMAELINERIEKLSRSKSPSSVLQYARSLNPELMEKEKITGALSADYQSRLDEKLGIAPIDTDELAIERFPELPDINTPKKEVVRLCRQVYRMHKQEIQTRLIRLKQRAALSGVGP